jgi:hypothetical protein
LNGIISALKQQTNDDITLVATPSFVWGEDDFNHQFSTGYRGSSSELFK